MYFRYVDAEGNDYQPPYFPPPQFEQQNGQYTTFQQDGQDGQFSQQAIIMNEDGQELLEEIDENGQPQQQRQIIVGGDNYIITQDGLAVQAVDGQQVIMCEVTFLELQLLPDNCQPLLAMVSQKRWQCFSTLQLEIYGIKNTYLANYFRSWLQWNGSLPTCCKYNYRNLKWISGVEEL